MSKVNSLARAKLGGLVGASSVGFGLNGLKFGGNAENKIPNKKNSECNCYFMFRAKSVDMVDTFSVSHNGERLVAVTSNNLLCIRKRKWQQENKP